MTDELWKRCNSDERLETIYGLNKVRVHAKICGETAPEVKLQAPKKKKLALLKSNERIDAENDRYAPLTSAAIRAARDKSSRVSRSAQPFDVGDRRMVCERWWRTGCAKGVAGCFGEPLEVTHAD